MIYTHGDHVPIPNADLLTFLFDSEHSRSVEDTVIHAEAKDPKTFITKGRARVVLKQIAHFFRDSYGIGRSGPGKDIVVTVSTGQSALACVFFGVVASEGVYSAASPSSTATDLARQIKDGPGKLLVCSKDLRQLALSAAKLAGLPERNVLILESHPEISLASADGSVQCEFKRSLPWRRITDPEELENSTICILYSSGTTGLPKGVRISHTNVISEAHLVAAVTRPVTDKWEKEGKGFERRTIGHLPTAHIAGVQGYFITAMYGGGTVYWMPSFNFDDFVHYCSTLQITSFFSVPPIFMAIAKHPAVKDQFKKMRVAISGAAPLSRDMQSAASEKLNKDAFVGQVYGLSETTGAVTHTPLDSPDGTGSLGPLMPNVLLRLVDDDGNDVAPRQPGEAWLKGPTITKGYHNNDKANAEAFTSDGWFRTGDILKMENDVLYVVDRKKELIKYKGLQVAPAELEGLLTAHPAVTDAAVIGMPTERTEVPRAYVVLAPSMKGKVTEAHFVDYVKEKVSDHKQLRGGVVFIEAIPRSPAGKILRKDLRERLSQEMRASSKL